jgi:hypothetical protein
VLFRIAAKQSCRAPTFVNFINTGLISTRVFREMPAQGIFHFLKPLRPLVRRAGDDNAEHLAIDVLDSAEAEHAVFPQ